MRTSSLPASARSSIWPAVAAGSAVSVLVMLWTTTGCAEPTGTPPTSTVTVRLRSITRLGSISGKARRSLRQLHLDRVQRRALRPVLLHLLHGPVHIAGAQVDP